VKSTGDGALLEFPSVVDAVECAVAVQAVMDQRNEGVPVDRRMLFRIGINLGDILIEGDDILGDGVNIAARLEGIAEPGGICISSSAYDRCAARGRVPDLVSEVIFDQPTPRNRSLNGWPGWPANEAKGRSPPTSPPSPAPIPEHRATLSRNTADGMVEDNQALSRFVAA
jgi:hypothetical protein